MTMLEFVTGLAERAGGILLEHYRPLGRAAVVAVKGQARNWVTAADTASEEFIVAGIRERFPGHSINAEETGEHSGDGRHVWYVDPLDGTVNFTHGFPFFAVSIGLVVDGVPRLGAVCAPVLGETFAGEVGVGSWLNGEPLGVSKTGVLIDSLLATGFSYVRNEHPDHNVDNFADLVMRSRDIRRAGAAAIDICYVAAGRFDGFWEVHLSPWDVAAAAAILRGAGGRVSDFRGGEDFLVGKNIVATNGAIHEALRAGLHPLRSL